MSSYFDACYFSCCFNLAHQKSYYHTILLEEKVSVFVRTNGKIHPAPFLFLNVLEIVFPVSATVGQCKNHESRKNMWKHSEHLSTLRCVVCVCVFWLFYGRFFCLYSRAMCQYILPGCLVFIQMLHNHVILFSVEKMGG